MKPMRTTAVLYALTTILGLALLCLAASSDQELGIIRFERYRLSTIPFEVGETLEYQFGWNGIPSATGVAKVERVAINGKEYFALKIASRTNPIIDILWKMRDRGISIVDPRTLLPVRHEIFRIENQRRRRQKIIFDHEKRIAYCVREKLDKGEVDKIKLSFQFAFDPISVSYFMRGLDWKVGDERHVEFIENNHRYVLTIRVVGKERINVAAGTFDTLKVEPKLAKLTGGGDLKEKLKKAYIWVTDDKRHIPVKLKSAVFIGHVYADLVRYSLGGETKQSEE